MKSLLICSLGSIFINLYMVVFLYNIVIYVFYCYVFVFLLCAYVSSSCQLAFFGYPY